MPDNAGPADRPVRVLGWLMAVQFLSVLLLFAGGVVLIITIANNNAQDCSGFDFPGTATVSCHRTSLTLPVALLIAGGGAFVLSAVASMQYALRHVGAPVINALLARRRLRDQTGFDPTMPPPPPPSG